MTVQCSSSCRGRDGAFWCQVHEGKVSVVGLVVLYIVECFQEPLLGTNGPKNNKSNSLPSPDFQNVQQLLFPLMLLGMPSLPVSMYF